MSGRWPLRAVGRVAALVATALVATTVAVVALAGVTPAAADGIDAPQPPLIPELPVPDPLGDGDDDGPITDDGAISIDIGTSSDAPSQSVLLIVGLAVLSLAPSLIVMLTSFARIVIVLTLTRNALGLQNVPPNQVLVGLALFLSLFIMSPTLTEVNSEALQPYLDGEISQEVALSRATGPLRAFMLEHTAAAEMELMLDASGQPDPASTDDIPLTAIIPAFMLSELKTAFTIGFVIFIPFLVIDIVVAAALMALGMMMLPPVFVSLPFKLLLFIMVGGWSMIVETLLASFG